MKKTKSVFDYIDELKSDMFTINKEARKYTLELHNELLYILDMLYYGKTEEPSKLIIGSEIYLLLCYEVIPYRHVILSSDKEISYKGIPVEIDLTDKYRIEVV